MTQISQNGIVSYIQKKCRPLQFAPFNIVELESNTRQIDKNVWPNAMLSSGWEEFLG